MSSEGALPAHRQVLSDLIAALHQPGSKREKSAENRVQLFPDQSSAASRGLILTLHVLFPDAVLPALDLLDRRLIDKLKLIKPEENCNIEASDYCETEGSTHRKIASFGGTKIDLFPAGDFSPHLIYAVRSQAALSAQQAAVRDTSQAASNTYIIHLTAWSCSCTAFALDKFHSRTHSGNQPVQFGKPARPLHVGGQGAGLSRLLHDGEDVPCCKHLLACLLAETWGHTNERCVSEHVMAGLVSTT